MNATADHIQGRQNMILKMIRRLNAAILGSVMGIKLRRVGATLLGCFAGLSLTSNIIPSAMEFTGATDSFTARWGMGGFAVYSVMVWGVGGWAAQKTGDKKLGAIVMGTLGLASGLIFTGIGIGTEMNLLLTGGGAGMFYGAIGGMIIGDALRDPIELDSDKEGIVNKKKVVCKRKPDIKDGVRLFRFFK